MAARTGIATACAGALLLQGCAIIPWGAYTNSELTPSSGAAPKASFEIAPRKTESGQLVKTQPRVLVLLALSGGGSRAAYLSARTMLALQGIPGPDGKTVNVLNEVDLISSVSGGSLAAAYYASTYDRDPASPFGRRVWDEQTIRSVMGKNYIGRWFGNWLWPENILRFWFSDFDRTDIMAQTLADNLFDNEWTGVDLQMSDLNPGRPNIVLNATIGTRSDEEADPERAKLFGSAFTFTREDFSAKLNSDIASYELARAVMASATFPAAFNYMTLRSYPNAGPGGASRYLHVFDGGNSDNSGLVSLKRVLLGNGAAASGNYDRIAVIFVDAFRRSSGSDPSSADPRKLLDYFVDTNFLDATDSLLEANRINILQGFFSRSIANHKDLGECTRDNLPRHACIASPEWKGPGRERLQQILNEKLFFFHVAFDAVVDAGLRDTLNSIPTTFKFGEGEMDAIERGVGDIFGAANTDTRACVRRLAELLAKPETTGAIVARNRWCGGGEKEEMAERLQKLQKK